MAAAQSEELAGLQDRLAKAHRIVECFDNLVPPDNALGAFLVRITTVMTEYDLIDQAVIPDKEVEGGDLGCIPIQITCKGTLANLFGFFRRLQSLDRLVRVESVQLENDTGFTGQLTMHAKAVIFYQLKPLKTTQNSAGAGAGNDA